MSVIDVALACGFVSASHFSKCYRDFFGRTPRKERGLPSRAEGGDGMDDELDELDADAARAVADEADSPGDSGNGRRTGS